mgnify:CR=1 FL=1
MPKFTLMFLALFGALLLGMIFHESIHLVQAKEPYSLCYDVAQNSTFHVTGDFENKNTLSLELPAYIISILATIVLFICIIIDFKFKL